MECLQKEMWTDDIIPPPDHHEEWAKMGRGPLTFAAYRSEGRLLVQHATPAFEFPTGGSKLDLQRALAAFGKSEYLLRAISMSTCPTLFRPFLAHFSPFFPRFFAVLSV